MEYSKGQLYTLVFLRIFIGWHLLYEGFIKLLNPAWSAKAYLENATSFLNSIYAFLASDYLIEIVDTLNVFGLVAIGLSLILGLYSRIATVAGALLLGLYYLAYPPFPWLDIAGPREGNYLFINKNLIEVVALLVLHYFPTDNKFGIQMLIKKSINGRR